VDIVVGLEPPNAIRGLNALLAIGYKMAVPATPEQFANPDTREDWRRSKGMIVLKLWSDEHRRTPVDIFVYEPFDFAAETLAANVLEVAPGLRAPLVSLETLFADERAGGPATGPYRYRGAAKNAMKKEENIRADWRWGTSIVCWTDDSAFEKRSSGWKKQNA
jgi:hypothetical protein